MADEDPIYLMWIRKQPCAWCGGPGPSHAHHSTSNTAPGGRRGKGERAHDHDAIPMHLRCHAQFHELSGPFKGWNKQRVRSWQDEQVDIHRERYAELFNERPWNDLPKAASKVLPRLGPVAVPENGPPDTWQPPTPVLPKRHQRRASGDPAVVIDLDRVRAERLLPVLTVYFDMRGESIFLNERIDEPLSLSQVLSIIDELNNLAEQRK